MTTTQAGMAEVRKKLYPNLEKMPTIMPEGSQGAETLAKQQRMAELRKKILAKKKKLPLAKPISKTPVIPMRKPTTPGKFTMA